MSRSRSSRQRLGAEQVAVAEDLDLAGGVVQVDEHAAVAHRPDAAGDPHAIVGFDACRQPGIASFELGRLMGALEAIGIWVDPERLEACRACRSGPRAADPRHRAIGARHLSSVFLQRASLGRRPVYPTATCETGLRARSTTVSWNRRKVP